MAQTRWQRFNATDEDGGAIDMVVERKTLTTVKFDHQSKTACSSFKDSPSFEAPEDIGGQYRGDNVYEVTVVANKRHVDDMTVTVTDVERGRVF